MQKDKILHFLVCAVITFVVTLLFFIANATFVISALAGVIASTAAGWGKEFGDKVNPNNKWDWKDIIADSLGTLFGIIVSSLLWIL